MSATLQEALDPVFPIRRALVGLNTAKGRLAALEAGRESILLSGDERAGAARDQEIAAARREVDRFLAAVRHLESRRAEASVNDKQEVVSERIRFAAKERERGLGLLNEYDRLAPIVKRFDEAVTELKGVAQTLAAVGDEADRLGRRSEVPAAALPPTTPNGARWAR